MTVYRGITWDHRGRDVLERSAQASDGLIEWQVQPLEGFESAPIHELAERFDVIVLDHPHLGDALASDSLHALDDLFAADWLTALAPVGRSLESYRLDGRLWALPLDAATQVAVLDPERLETPPATWQAVGDLSHAHPVALSLAGPHALLTFASVCVALGAPPRTDPGQGFVPASVARDAVELLTDLTRRAPAGSLDLNPIALLDRMREQRDIAYIPLVYGYVTHSTGPRPLRFADAPAAGSIPGSTLGGTGLAVSRRTAVGSDLLAYLAWHLDPLTQATFIPEHSGQPSARSAWNDPRVDAEAGGFYSGTLATIESAWVRPRVAGFTPFQSAASALLRAVFVGDEPPARSLGEIDRLFDQLASSKGSP